MLNILLQITFTRGRPNVKYDQGHVEQKNRAVVCQVVDYQRLEGEQATAQRIPGNDT
jgi:hypothetical protein